MLVRHFPSEQRASAGRVLVRSFQRDGWWACRANGAPGAA